MQKVQRITTPHISNIMALSRVSGAENIYISGIFAFRRASLLEEHHITHVLSVIKYSLDPTRGFDDGKYAHLSIDIDDVEEADILVQLPRMVRFIHEGLYGRPSSSSSDELDEAGGVEAAAASQDSPKMTTDNSPDAITPAPPLGNNDDSMARLSLNPDEDLTRGRPKGSVLVHCAMGKSRSVTAVVAYLLWKYPHRFGGSEARSPDRPEAARAAVVRALNWVRQTRGIAEPNDGFMSQLEIWWEMGCPADSDDAVEKHRVYRRWAYMREVEEAAKLGMAPDRLLFEDEEEKTSSARGEQPPIAEPGLELRCKKCRRVLVTKPFIVPHDSNNGKSTSACSHFVEPLSWMRPTLEEGLLEGRLACPGARCGASIGRYSWQGFKCSCGEWVCPAFCLQRGKVDEVATSPPRGPMAGAGEAERMAAMGIRLPPGGGVGGGRSLAPARGPPAGMPVKQNL